MATAAEQVTPFQEHDPTAEHSRRRQIEEALALFGPSCPLCSALLARSRVRGLESVWKFFTKRRPHRCHRCQWRGWRRPAPHDAAAIKRAKEMVDARAGRFQHIGGV